VHREITSIFAQNKVILRETKRAVTPYDGLSVFEFSWRARNSVHHRGPLNALDQKRGHQHPTMEGFGFHLFSSRVQEAIHHAPSGRTRRRMKMWCSA